MLDYSTVEVLSKSYYMFFETLKSFAPLIVLLGIITISLFYKQHYSAIECLFAGVGIMFIFSLWIFFTCSFIVKENYVRIETKDVEMSSAFFPSSDKCPRLEKVGDKVYFYTHVSSENTSSSYKIKKEVQEDFNGLLFDLQNQKK